jgi:hypothetical protein
MLDILPRGYDTASPASHTRWRDLSLDLQEEATYALIAKGAQGLAERLLADAGTTAARWTGLIEAFPNLAPEHRAEGKEVAANHFTPGCAQGVNQMPGTGRGLPNDADRKSRKDLIHERQDQASIDCRPEVGPPHGRVVADRQLDLCTDAARQPYSSCE